MYDEKQREWTPEQLAEAAQDALDNWEWDAETLSEVESQEESNDKKAIVESMTDVDANRDSYADDDGIIRINRVFSDIWDWISERMNAEYAAYSANRRQ